MLLEEPETLDAELLQEEEAEAKAEAEKTRPGAPSDSLLGVGIGQTCVGAFGEVRCWETPSG